MPSAVPATSRMEIGTSTVVVVALTVPTVMTSVAASASDGAKTMKAANNALRVRVIGVLLHANANGRERERRGEENQCPLAERRRVRERGDGDRTVDEREVRARGRLHRRPRLVRQLGQRRIERQRDDGAGR